LDFVLALVFVLRFVLCLALADGVGAGRRDGRRGDEARQLGVIAERADGLQRFDWAGAPALFIPRRGGPRNRRDAGDRAPPFVLAFV